MNSDHSYRVEAARAENAARKRESNLASTDRLSKVPKGNLIHSRNRPDTASGLLRPPQLGGRYVDLIYVINYQYSLFKIIYVMNFHVYVVLQLCNMPNSLCCWCR